MRATFRMGTVVGTHVAATEVGKYAVQRVVLRHLLYTKMPRCDTIAPIAGTATNCWFPLFIRALCRPGTPAWPWEGSSKEVS